MKIPEWYGCSPPDETIYRRRRSPVRKTLAEIGKALAVELSGEGAASSPLSRIDPRVKIITTLALIFGATLLHSIPAVCMLLAFAILVSVFGGLPVRRLARVWLGVPLFSAVIILPAALNVVTPGETIITLFTLKSGTVLTITDAGLFVIARFVLRTLTCVSLAVILTSTTEPSALINALGRLGMPRIFAMTLSMMQRYLALILRAAEDIHLAKLSRTITPAPVKSQQRWIAAGMGALFTRTHRLAEKVHLAMLSRGYDGSIQVRKTPGLRASDLLWTASAFIIMAALIAADRLRFL